ncbi:uncharacterized protein LOC133942587 [Platichthys flesus]|uniref:uncharacterized protein LOC133942587 n=1 Tax=Platichthys flesus TaxID=8260 RepID=UPI002DB64CC2|nr:uncharacterized protein LOC133942587 [Platichthys flesus]
MMEDLRLRVRRVCGHCNNDLSHSQYYEHKRQYFLNGVWVRKSEIDPTDAVQDSVASSQDHTGEINVALKLEDLEETEEMHLLPDHPENNSVREIPSMYPPTDTSDNAHSEIIISNVISTTNDRRLDFTSPVTPLNSGEHRDQSVSDSPAPTYGILLDAINGLARQMTVFQGEMNQKLDDLSQAAAVSQAMMASLDERLTLLESNRVSVLEPKRKRRAQCPRLAETVRRLHKTSGKRYDPEQLVSSRHNESVTSHLVDALAKSPDWRTVRTDLIASACKTYYGTVRRNFCYSLPEHEHMGSARKSSARSRQRRKRLLVARQRVLLPDELEFWRGTTIEMMSDEEDGSSEGLSGWIVRPPSFRSQELSDLCAKLQTRLEADQKYTLTRHRRLHTGADSERSPPRVYNPEDAKKHFKPEMRP